MTALVSHSAAAGALLTVLAGQEGRHGAVLRRRMDDLRGQQRPRQVVAENRDDEADADEDAAPRSDEGFQDAGHRRRGQARQVGSRHHAVGQHRHQDEQAQHREEAQHRRLADILAVPWHSVNRRWRPRCRRTGRR